MELEEPQKTLNAICLTHLPGKRQTYSLKTQTAKQHLLFLFMVQARQQNFLLGTANLSVQLSVQTIYPDLVKRNNILRCQLSVGFVLFCLIIHKIVFDQKTGHFGISFLNYPDVTNLQVATPLATEISIYMLHFSALDAEVSARSAYMQ